jgi:hypothetical protein
MADLEEEFPFQTNMSRYQKRRHEVMSEEEIAESDKFLEWFRSSHQDKENRGLFDKWETIDLYWEGEANPPESDTDPASNTNIVNANVEGQVAYLVEQNIAIEAKPRGPSDKPWRDRAVMVMEFVKEQNKMKRKLDVHERRREKFGTGIFRVLFDPDALDGFGLPCIEPCNPAYVFFDPTITDIYKIQQGRFAIEIVNRSLNYAREKYDEELVSAIEPGYHPMEAEMVFGEDEGENDEISRDSYLHMFIFTRYKKNGELRLRLVEMSGCGVILRDTKKEEEQEEETADEEAQEMAEDEDRIFPDERYPYFLTPDMYREGTVWAKSTAELVIPQQDLIDDLDDQIRYNARLTGNPQRLVSIDSGIDPDKVTNESSISIPTADMNGYKWVEPPRMAESIFRRRDQALGIERQIVTRWSDQQAGVKQQGVDTATEALSLSQGANSGINHKKLLLEETLAEVFEYCLELCMKHWTEEQFFELTEKPGEYDFFRPSDLAQVPRLIPATSSYQQAFTRDFPNAQETPHYMPLMGEPDEMGNRKPITQKIALNISVTVGAGMPQNKAFVYSVIKEAMGAQLITPPEGRKLLKEYVGLPIDEEPPIDMNQVQQMIQQAIQQAMTTQQPPNPNVMGMTQNNAPAAPVIPGGMAL